MRHFPTSIQQFFLRKKHHCFQKNACCWKKRRQQCCFWQGKTSKKTKLQVLVPDKKRNKPKSNSYLSTFFSFWKSRHYFLTNLKKRVFVCVFVCLSVFKKKPLFALPLGKPFFTLQIHSTFRHFFGASSMFVSTFLWCIVDVRVISEETIFYFSFGKNTFFTLHLIHSTF